MAFATTWSNPFSRGTLNVVTKALRDTEFTPGFLNTLFLDHQIHPETTLNLYGLRFHNTLSESHLAVHHIATDHDIVSVLKKKPTYTSSTSLANRFIHDNPTNKVDDTIEALTEFMSTWLVNHVEECQKGNKHFKRRCGNQIAWDILACLCQILSLRLAWYVVLCSGVGDTHFALDREIDIETTDISIDLKSFVEHNVAYAVGVFMSKAAPFDTQSRSPAWVEQVFLRYLATSAATSMTRPPHALLEDVESRNDRIPAGSIFYVTTQVMSPVLLNECISVLIPMLDASMTTEIGTRLGAALHRLWDIFFPSVKVHRDRDLGIWPDGGHIHVTPDLADFIHRSVHSYVSDVYGPDAVERACDLVDDKKKVKSTGRSRRAVSMRRGSASVRPVVMYDRQSITGSWWELSLAQMHEFFKSVCRAPDVHTTAYSVKCHSIFQRIMKNVEGFLGGHDDPESLRARAATNDRDGMIDFLRDAYHFVSRNCLAKVSAYIGGKHAAYLFQLARWAGLPSDDDIRRLGTRQVFVFLRGDKWAIVDPQSDGHLAFHSSLSHPDCRHLSLAYQNKQAEFVARLEHVSGTKIPYPKMTLLHYLRTHDVIPDVMEHAQEEFDARLDFYFARCVAPDGVIHIVPETMWELVSKLLVALAPDDTASFRDR
jgi:hypothetical protein